MVALLTAGGGAAAAYWLLRPAKPAVAGTPVPLRQVTVKQNPRQALTTTAELAASTHGTQARRLLSEEPATALTPVVALSANAMPRDIAKGLAAGFFRYLTKPIKVGEFMNTLDVAFEISEARRENRKEKA